MSTTRSGGVYGWLARVVVVAVVRVVGVVRVVEVVVGVVVLWVVVDRPPWVVVVRGLGLVVRVDEVWVEVVVGEAVVVREAVLRVAGF